MTIPLWLLSIFASAFIGGVMGLGAWLWRISGDVRVMSERLDVLIKQGEAHNIAVIDARLAAFEIRLATEEAERKASHERNRGRIEDLRAEIYSRGGTRP